MLLFQNVMDSKLRTHPKVIAPLLFGVAKIDRVSSGNPNSRILFHDSSDLYFSTLTLIKGDRSSQSPVTSVFTSECPQKTSSRFRTDK
jgi:hypothetical protein